MRPHENTGYKFRHIYKAIPDSDFVTVELVALCLFCNHLRKISHEFTKIGSTNTNNKEKSGLSERDYDNSPQCQMQHWSCVKSNYFRVNQVIKRKQNTNIYNYLINAL